MKNCPFLKAQSLLNDNVVLSKHAWLYQPAQRIGGHVIVLSVFFKVIFLNVTVMLLSTTSCAYLPKMRLCPCPFMTVLDERKTI